MYAGWYFVAPQFFIAGISCVQYFFSLVFLGPGFFLVWIFLLMPNKIGRSNNTDWEQEEGLKVGEYFVNLFP